MTTWHERLRDLPLPSYPFPDLINPQADALAAEYCQWIDEDYAFHSEGARALHKRHRLCDIASRGFPGLTLAELRPIARYTAAGAMMDDYLDHCGHDEMITIRDRIVALLTGEDPNEPADFGVFRQFWLLRREALACGMPDRLYLPFVDAIDRVLTGYADEKQWMAADTPPPLGVYLVLREDTSGAQPYAAYVCMEQNFRTLPDRVLRHPHVQRMHRLISRLIGMHNDLISLPKEMGRRGDVINIVRVMQKEHDVSIADAAGKALALHDAYLDQFITLGQHLPDFGPWQDLAVRYVRSLGIMVQGVWAWHTNDRERYVPSGYVEGEFPSREFTWTS